VRKTQDCTYAFNLLSCALEGSAEFKEIWKKYNERADLKAKLALD